MKLFSPAFDNNGAIPRRHTGFGEDLSPELRVSGIPAAAVSLAVTMGDLDIPLRGELSHWVIWNIALTDVIPEGLPAGERIDSPIGAVQGMAWGKHRYRGPKQPLLIHRAHRYRFRLYALDRTLDIGPESDRKALLKAMDGHILEQAELAGVYTPETKR